MSEKLSTDAKLKSLKGKTLGDFWSWGFSNILSNATRGVFAEFIVGCALGAIDKPRVEWDAYDFIYKGKGIEVKSSAYIQSWRQIRPSHITFDIAPKRSLNANTNAYDGSPGRSADCYVFCLFKELDEEKVDVLDISQWEFYVLSTEFINQKLGKQKSISLNPLRKLCNPVSFEGIKPNVDKILGP